MPLASCSRLCSGSKVNFLASKIFFATPNFKPLQTFYLTNFYFVGASKSRSLGNKSTCWQRGFSKNLFVNDNHGCWFGSQMKTIQTADWTCKRNSWTNIAIFVMNLASRINVQVFRSLLECSVLRKIFCQVSTHQGPIIVYLWYTNAEHNGRKNKINAFVHTMNI